MRTLVQYWTMFYMGGTEKICSKHASLQAARDAARRCENRGGAKHRIVETVEAVAYSTEPRGDRAEGQEAK